MSNDLTIECAAKLGYEHSCKMIDKIYPKPEMDFTWETENENCKNEWLEKARIMLEPILQREDNLRSAVKTFLAVDEVYMYAPETTYAKRIGKLQEALSSEYSDNKEEVW